MTELHVRESDNINAGIRWFYANGMIAFRTNTGAHPFEYTRQDGSKVKRYVRYGTPGFSDILALQPETGRAIFAEGKSTTGQQSDVQKQFQAKVEAAGALYVLFRSLDDLEQRKNEILGRGT